MRSSETLRALTFGAARSSIDTLELEVDVIQVPNKMIVADVAAGSLIQQGPLITLQGSECDRDAICSALQVVLQGLHQEYSTKHVT